MVKRILKRYTSLLMIAALVLATIPIIFFPAFAASTSGTVTGLSDTNIGLSFNGEVEDPWSAGSTTITGSATNATTCENTPKKESKLTIKNKSSSVAKLIFKYDVTLNSGSVTIDGTSVTSAGTFSKEIGAGGSIIVDLIAGDKSKATVVTLSDIQLILKKTVTATFKAPQHGSYTVNGTQITSDWVNTGSSFDPYTVPATPDSGYIFMGWYNAETMRSISTDASCSLSLNGDCTVMPKFVSNSAALFTAVGRAFDDIDEASEYAAANKQSTVILSKSGTYDKNSTVPSGITLLIPFDAANTVYTAAPEYVEKEEAQSAYRTLTLKSGATITVNGALSVGGKHFTATTAFCNKPTGPYGHIKTEAGSKITLNSGANLYAWGYITGDGEVIANSGSKVYEYFQITDWRGGSAMTDMLGNKQKVFPFSQYYIQNIEAPLTLKSGADEYTYLSLTAKILGSTTTTKATTIHFVGQSGAMFNMSAGSEFSKRYIPSQDRISFKTKGNIALKSITLTVSASGIDKKVDSADYVLPINNNVSLEIVSGTATISQDLALQPGVNVTIDKDAEMKVSKGYKLYIYDKAEWSTNYVWTSKNGGIKQIAYTVSSHPTRSLTNTVIDVNGALTAEGDIYTTKSSAEIISSKSTGVYNQVSAPASAAKTYQYNQSAETYVEIPVTAAKLKNVNSTFTETASASAGDSIKFVNKEWGGKEPVYVTVTFNPNFSGIAEKTQSVESGVDTKLNTNSFSRTGYTFKGWNTNADGSGTAYVNGATVNISKDTVLYAQWEVNTYTVTWKNGDTVLQSTKVAYGTKPAYTGTTPTKAATAQYTYTFKGWTPEIVAVTGDTTYTAEFNSVLREYTVTWKNGDTVLQSGKVAYGTKPAYTGATPTKTATAQYTYSFKGWSPEITEVTGNVTYTAVFDENGKNGLCVDGSDTYWIMNGQNVDFPGLIRINVGTDDKPHYHYYYFAEGGKAVKDGTYKVNKNNGLPLPEFNYDFDADGVIVHDEDTSKNGICDGDGSKFYYVDGIKSGVGLIKVGDSYYYARTSTAEIVRNRTYWISNTNDLSIEPGMYHFDDDGRMILNGLISDSDGDYYFVNGTSLKGFTKIGGDYYIFNSYSGKMYKDATMWVGSNDYGIASSLYYFGADGKMSVPDTENGKKSIVEKDGKLYFTIDGAYMTSGLYELDGEYYYVQNNGELAANKTVWVDNKNGLIPEKGNWYAFDESGKLIKTGFVNGSDGYTYYYNNTVLALGFTKIGGDYYIFNSYSGKMYKDATMWVGSNDYGIASSLYYFGADGKMSVPDTENGKKAIVEKDGKLYFTIDGVKMTNGLNTLDGEYYYANTNGELAVNKTVWVSQKNDLISEKGNWYAFDKDGKMIKTGFVNGGDGYTYYYNDTILALGFTKIGDDYYIFNNFSGKMYKDAKMWVGNNDYGIVGGSYYFDSEGRMTTN